MFVAVAAPPDSRRSDESIGDIVDDERRRNRPQAPSANIIVFREGSTKGRIHGETDLLSFRLVPQGPVAGA